MKLNKTELRGFAGGMLEVQNRQEGYLFGGEIKEVFIDESNVLRVNLAWSGIDRDFPRVGRMVNDDRLGYSISLEKRTPLDYVHRGGILIDTGQNSEIVLLFPKSAKRDSNIQPSKVEGLVLKAKR